MNVAPVTADAREERERGISETLIRTLVPQLNIGTLRILLPSGRRIIINGLASGPEASIQLIHLRTLRRLLFGGDIGFGEAYMDGDWSSPDLPTLIALFAQNQAAIPLAAKNPVTARLVGRLRHLSRMNSLAGSRRNIMQHYDLGNDFYGQWLDHGMSYSSGLFETPDMTLEEAQTAKQDRILAMLGLRSGESVLEIGVGWGGLLNAWQSLAPKLRA